MAEVIDFDRKNWRGTQPRAKNLLSIRPYGIFRPPQAGLDAAL